MGVFVSRTDPVTLKGQVVSCWNDSPQPPYQFGYDWHIIVMPESDTDPLLVNAAGDANPLNMIECRVTPTGPYREEPWASEILGELVGKSVRISGTWGDGTDDSGFTRTLVWPITWIVTESLSIVVEEHGFTQAVRDVSLYAFSDDSVGLDIPLHHREDRHLNVSVPFPHRPQSEAVPVYATVVDRDYIEQQQYFADWLATPRFPLVHVRGQSFGVASSGGVDNLNIVIDTGTAADDQGFLYEKLALTYDEPFDEMCQPNVCVHEPGKNCQATGEMRYAWRWPRLDSAQSGDLLLGPAGGTGIIGVLLAALHPAQFYDHMVLFVEDDGQTVRHCTASDDRIQAERYYNGKIKVTTPLGDVEQRIPLKGIRGDILAFAWPGSITQTLGEVSQTGRNTANAQFSYDTFYPKVISAEGLPKPPLWQMEPSERDKRTSYHDPEATESAIKDADRRQRAWYAQTRLQTEPAWRTELGKWIWPVLVKPHPMLDASVRDALRVVAQAAKDIQAHYRFYGYSQSAIAGDSNFNAPPESGWAAGTIAGVCSSFVWAAVQNANEKLRLAGDPVIELEGEPDPTDERPPAGKDGIYQYTEEERRDAAKALWQNTYDRVAAQVQEKIDDLPGIVSVILPGDTASAAKDMLSSVVANQLCNIFAFDHTADFVETWANPGPGAAVSPDDTELRWDVRADPNTLPPARDGKIAVYGTYASVAVPKAGWVAEPIIKIRDTKGQGNISGVVRKRDTPAGQLQPVVGATVRFGCRVTTSSVIEERRGVYRFTNVAAGQYFLQASQFVDDPIVGTAVEWKSDPRFVDLQDGDNIDDVDLELLPPPGLARTIKIDSHHDIVDRVVVGKDRWGHFNLGTNLGLAWDPRDDPSVPADQRNTKLDGSANPIVTPEVGSGVHVRVEVAAKLKQTNVAANPYDGTVIVDTTLTFYDTSEGEVNKVLSDTGRELATGEPTRCRST